MSDQAEYDRDFFLWTREQARILREGARLGVNLPADWEHVAEEIENLGGSQRRELGSRMVTIIQHLLKLQSTTSTAPRAGWRATITRERGEIEALLEDSPSLRREVPTLLPRRMHLARKSAAEELGRYGDALGEVPDYTEEQVLGDWFPPDGR